MQKGPKRIPRFIVRLHLESLQGVKTLPEVTFIHSWERLKEGFTQIGMDSKLILLEWRIGASHLSNLISRQDSERLPVVESLSLFLKSRLLPHQITSRLSSKGLLRQKAFITTIYKNRIGTFLLLSPSQQLNDHIIFFLSMTVLLHIEFFLKVKVVNFKLI